MKKKLVILMLFLFISGCSKDNGKTAASVEVYESESSKEQNTKQEIESKEEKEADYKGYAFVYDDVVIEINAPAAPVLEKLGEANSYFEAPSCAFDGIDKIYTYNSFELDTYPLDGEDFVSSVLFKDDTVATMEGICIGDSAEKLAEAYGETSTEEDGKTVYCKDGIKLCFIIEDGCISSIEYKTTILDE